ncbi:Arc family DNA-binding protein [Thiopseudomonas acetoxidans]|uniref:Arc family DNA-binding protein n=1 Tax=Thiopseudomonas acetoxidans TaxID=3041622 RepID=A0ABT7SMC6_9GAMM|nr:Arc family DNA-binding protein [Thiopseudomonas sp. CY1220]MDM7857332.1 Arc family DNA-binding protein [Thiopseudomonas sp. CY1220]
MSTARKIANTSRTADKFVVRLPSGMRNRIAEVARNNHRSMNSEIIARIEQSLNQEDGVNLEQGLRIDSPELSIHERELLQHFRFLAQRQQNALLALITHDIDTQNED